MAAYVENAVAITQKLQDSVSIPTLDFSALQIDLPDPSKIIGFDLEKMRKEMEASWQRMMDELEINKKTGWWSVDCLVGELPANEVHRAILDEEVEGSYTKLVIQRFTENDFQRAREMEQRWMQHSFLSKERKAVLAAVIQAHIEGKYSLSIPAILPQIEHFFKEELVAKHGEVTDEFIDKVEKRKAGFGYLVEIYPVQFFFKELLFAPDWHRDKQPIERKLLSEQNNRHRILHGEDENYAQELWSMKAILFLDKVFDLIVGTTESTK